MILNKFKRVFMGLAGTSILFVAIFLIIFPVLPVRPLLKIIKLCYFNSSEKLYHWFTQHSVFGSILDKKFVLSKKSFVFRTLLMLALLFGVMYFSDNLIIRLVSTVLVVCAILYNYYKTLK